MKIKQIKKKKHLIRSLKVYAKANCIQNTYYALEKFYKPKIIDGEYKTGLIVEHNVSHERRVKKAFKKYGIQAAIAYLTAFKKEKEA